MKDKKEWPRDSIALLAKKVNGSVCGQDYVDWAVQALAEGFNSPSLLILSSLDIDKNFSKWEAEKFFIKVITELSWIIPSDEVILRTHLVTLATQIEKGDIDPEVGIERIHREVVSPLGHPEDLRAWCFLWEGNSPTGNGVIPKDEYRLKIFEFVRKWLVEKDK